ncbi:acyclic terpene utilization AtuA family protein [Castellaniella caeni]|uniref:acyclic terpene utilization AtuA family protein n=1 Tax=Castellaniella caeni TaxID=266123 RepID=UPI000A46E6C1|nr:acyclic terpene utilization AtuA family protein [Castellaniella caeni]
MDKMKQRIRLGSGAGYSGDRIDPAVELARDGAIDYLIFECLAERTIALAQLERLHQPERGYDPLLTERMQAVLPYLRDADGTRRFRIISNMGAANPRGAVQEVCRVATALGLHGLKVAAVLGDDVLDAVRNDAHTLLDIGITPKELGSAMVSANAYLGAGGIVQALQADADVVITGRVADPALFLAPQVLEFGLSWDDWPALGRGTLVGHLLECAGQVTGGYFADPGFKDVAGLARLGFPIAEVSAEGAVCITKVAGSGGRVTPQTCSEQLIYEIHDPQAYLTPDVVADFSQVAFHEIAPDRVSASGADGHPKPATLKVSVGYLDGYIGEGQISYGGPGALARARLAREIVLERLPMVGVRADEVRADLIGVDSLYGATLGAPRAEPAEVRLRVAARCAEQHHAQLVGREVEALYTNGPAGGGGASKLTKQVVAVASLLWPAERIQTSVHFEVSQ